MTRLLIDLACRIPVFGWMIRSAHYGDDSERIWFAINLGQAWLITIFLFGYPAFIVPLLAIVLLAFAALISLTTGP
ncbi:MAG: hypothetical protein AB7F96_14865 [Beijerinckiaceae bacterium]